MLAIDIGFSACKCKADGREWKFPSFVAPAKQATVNLGEGPTGYLFKGQRYNVGNPTDGADGAKYVREISFLLEYGPLFVAHAIKGMKEKPGILAVGLPLEQFKEYRDQLRAAISDFEINGRQYEFDVRVFPQAVGALVEYAHEANPPLDEDRKSVV